MSRYRSRRNGPSLLGVGLLILLVLAIGFLFIPFLLMVAWNAVMPPVFGLPQLNFIEALALTVVISLLTGGLRGSRG